jgi:hypothetical protein
MWESRSDFQEPVGRAENLLLVFRAFHGSSFLPLYRLLSGQLLSLLLFVSTAPKSVGFGAGLENVSTVSDAIQQRFA